MGFFVLSDKLYLKRRGIADDLTRLI